MSFFNIYKNTQQEWEKPKNCSICFESLKNQETPLVCGHWIHINCIKQQFKAECPICRHPLEIKVFGEFPRSNIEPYLYNHDIYYNNRENILCEDLSDYEEEEDRENDFILAKILSDDKTSEKLLNNPLSPLYATPVNLKK